MKYTAGIITFLLLSAFLALGAPEAADKGPAYNAGRIVAAALSPLLVAGVVLLVAKLFGKAQAPGAGAKLVFWTLGVLFLLNVASFGLRAPGVVASRSITDAERQALEIGRDSIRHRGFGFALPSPGAAFERDSTVQRALEAQFVKQPNVGGWALRSGGAVVIVLVTKGGKVTEAIFRAFAKGIRTGVAGAEGLNVLEDSVAWAGTSGEYRFWAQNRNYTYLGIRCLPGTRPDAPVIVCVETVSASRRGDDELEFVRTGFTVDR
jgi:hypothetical protein